MSDIRSLPSRPRLWRHLPRASVFLWQMRRLLSQVAVGEITLVLPGGECLWRQGASPGPSAKIVIRRWRAIWRLMFGGELAFAQSFMDGDWWTPNLLAFLEFGASNEAHLKQATTKPPGGRLLDRFRHWQHRNTRRGSRRNIAAHYDLGNAFYKLWLDRDMHYSSALFAKPDQTIEAAQRAKLERVVELLEISGGERVLEIGCGWGGLMERLSMHCDITGITLSGEQRAYARQRLETKSIESADVRLQDYREINETYDRIVSIEMVEAVGERFWPVYFAKLRQSLNQGGTVLLQAITIADDRFAQYRIQPDFIQRHIFPGGFLPTVDMIRRQAWYAGLELVFHQSFGDSYARTLAIWRERFLASWPLIEQLGFDASFKRMWEYYLCYCEVGFRNGALDVGFYKFRPCAGPRDAGP